ncbi:MAG: hypothetical protein IPL79_06790 [Myxococcales bacterium]|nr:hypothetical protein [Myxococcales bacterium]
MRLRTCIVAEGIVAGGAVLAVILIAVHEPTPQASQPLRSASSPAADAATARLPEGVPIVARAPASTPPAVPEPVVLEAAPPSVETSSGPFSQAGDNELLRPLRDEAVVTWKTNTGGTSLSLRVEFASGARAAFKPEQIHGGSTPRREIAAYRLDRLLGLGRVPPAVGRSFSRDEFVAKAASPADRARFDEEAIAVDGTIRGELSWWVPVLVSPLVNGYPFDETEGIMTWRKMLLPSAEVPEPQRLLLAQLSDLTAFDFLVGNVDRWTGGNLKGNKAQTQLYFLDNTMAFSPDAGTGRTLGYLQRVGKFSRRLVARLRGLTGEEIVAALQDPAPFDYLLSNDEIAGILRRRDVFIGYVDDLIAKHGEAKVLAFP